MYECLLCIRCGNVASILELDEHLRQEYKVFSHAPIVSCSYRLFSLSLHNPLFLSLSFSCWRSIELSDTTRFVIDTMEHELQ
jgi:hypothetical protein